MSSFESELSRVSAVILDLDGTLLDTERATKDVLKDFLAKYGKVLDKKREEEKRLGMTQKESAAAIVRDYGLPLTPDQFIQEITPMYRETWPSVKALPGADRLIRHLYSHQVPFALASNSLNEYSHAKNSCIRDILPSVSMSSFESELRRVSAVIFDLDGTLLDTERATKDVLKDFLEKYGKVLDKKREEETRLGMTQKESAAAIVWDYGLPLTPDQFIQEITPMYREKWPSVKALPGADRLIRHLYSHKVPFALASNSLNEYIHAKISCIRGWKDWFSVILGSDQVIEGKPAPYLFEEAAKRMGVDASHCLVIEDSLVGVKAAKAAKMKVVAVPSRGEVECSSLADKVLHSLLEFQPELWGLPPFEDWVDRTLPIDPIYMSTRYLNGSMSEISEDASLPDQVFGTFFGWAGTGTAWGPWTIKVVVNIGWKCCSCTKKKRIWKLWFVDECDSKVFEGQQMQLLLVGYICMLNNKDLATVDAKEMEEFKYIANTSLDLPMFANHSCTFLTAEETFSINE